MRFHKSESAFFVFIAVILLTGAVTLHAYAVLRESAEMLYLPQRMEGVSYLGQLLSLIGVLLATALVFGMFFILPLIRTQVREQSKLKAMTKTLSARSETFQQAALTDALTGMQNRRYFDDALREYLVEFRRIAKPVGLLIVDLDHFKLVNDTHGHDIGDEVLRAVAKALKDTSRHHDIVARLGGEEFAVVAPNMNAAMLGNFAERLRRAIATTQVHVGGTTLKVTASVGIASWDGEERAEEFFRRADKQLYHAKRQGRNRVSA